ncbi:MAG: hypothetical protein HY674_12120 [Chloroflexi bacterium]|nr:hypothetical protein [Chloroflexota bacterium]
MHRSGSIPGAHKFGGWKAAAPAILVLLMALFLTGDAAAAEEGAVPAQGRDFPAFKLIYERNIFNPNRRPGSARGAEGEAVKPAKVDRFSLIGTLIYEQGSFAFFDGTEAQYRTVLKPSGTIAGFKLLEITPNHVRLNTSSNTVDLPMGMQMKRQDEGDWQLVAETGTGRTSGSDSNANEKSSEVSSGSEAGADEVLKRLMQKREQETK